MGLAICKYFIQTIFGIKIEIGVFEISNVSNLGTFNFWANWSLTGSKYLIKIIFDIEIEIGIFEISNVPNFNKF